MRTSKYEALVNEARDAIVNFNCVQPNTVNVVVIAEGGRVNLGTFERDTDVVAIAEEKYMFFADQADTARQQIAKGVSCHFNVYFREP